MTTRIGRVAAAITVALVVLAAACGDGDDRVSVAFSEPADGAAVAGGVAVTMTAVGVTIEDGLDQVDASARQAVATSVDWAAGLTDAMVAATDGRDVERLLEPIFAAGEEESGAGAPWILDNCGIDIDG